MKDSLRWSYAINAWKVRSDMFVRRVEQQRALRTMSVLGFDAVELNAGSGRWETLGRPEIMALNFGGFEGVRDFLADAGLTGASSIFWDPSAPAEEEGWALRNVFDPAHHDAAADAAQPFLDLLRVLGGERLVVRLSPPAWRTGPLEDAQIRVLGQLADRLGERAAESGLGIALHYDCLSGVHTRDQLLTLLDSVQQPDVGLALDTAEFTVGGIDPLAFLRENGDRISHVHLKDTRYADTGEEYLTPGAETAMLRGGDGRRIERWFFELGTEGGLVDLPAFVQELRDQRYSGWVVVEGDGGDDPTEIAMLNSWYVQKRLGASVR